MNWLIFKTFRCQDDAENGAWSSIRCRSFGVAFNPLLPVPKGFTDQLSHDLHFSPISLAVGGDSGVVHDGGLPGLRLVLGQNRRNSRDPCMRAASFPAADLRLSPVAGQQARSPVKLAHQRDSVSFESRRRTTSLQYGGSTGRCSVPAPSLGCGPRPKSAAARSHLELVIITTSITRLSHDFCATPDFISHRPARHMLGDSGTGTVQGRSR